MMIVVGGGYVKNSPWSLLVDDGKASPTSGNSRGLGNWDDDDDDDGDDDDDCWLLPIVMIVWGRIIIIRFTITKQWNFEERFE